MAKQRITRALTVRQPWAWAIMEGRKHIENRRQRTHVRERIAIHSSKKPDPNRNALAALLEDAATRIECMQSPNGAILGTVELVECIDKNEDHTFVGPYGRGWPVRVPCANRFPRAARGSCSTTPTTSAAFSSACGRTSRNDCRPGSSPTWWSSIWTSRQGPASQTVGLSPASNAFPRERCAR